MHQRNRRKKSGSTASVVYAISSAIAAISGAKSGKTKRKRGLLRRIK